MRYIRHKLMVNNIEIVLDHDSIEFLRELWGLLNVISNWVAITAAYGFTEKYDKERDSSRLGFAPPKMERYPRDLSVLRYPSSSGQTQGDLITGMPEHGNEKREQNR